MAEIMYLMYDIDTILIVNKQITGPKIRSVNFVNKTTVGGTLFQVQKMH